MAVDTPSINVNPYTSTVPLVQVPIGEQDAATRPAPPLAGRFGKRGTGGLAIGDAIVKGLLAGRAVKEQRKNAEAQTTIAAADAAQEAAYGKYQDALTQSGGTENDQTKAAYQAYIGVFNQSKEAKAKFVIPEKPQKSSSSGGQKKAGAKDAAKTGFGNIKEFFEANPHIVPQIALMTMQPKPMGLSREAKLQNLQMDAAQAEVESAKTGAQLNKEKLTQEQAQNARQEQERQVNSAGGYDAVISNPNADPTMKQTAMRMRSEYLGAQTPQGQMYSRGLKELQSGEAKNWTPEQRAQYAKLGVVTEPVVVTRTGKNGHQEEILVDPSTNQPVAGSKPLDLGPPAWASEFYAKRAADKADMRRAVQENPTQFGITLTGNAAQDKAAVSARADLLSVQAEFGINNLAAGTGSTAYEIQRNNAVLQDVVKAAGLNTKTSPLDSGQVMMSYPGGKSFAVGREYFNKILDKFTTPATENNGIRGFRDAPTNPDNNPPGVMEAERQFMYKWVKNQMMLQGKGKNALTSEQADQILKQTALGRPITGGGVTRPSDQQQASGGVERPPTGATKMYSVNGQIYELTDDDVAKAKANHIQVEPVDQSVLQQLQ